MIFLILLGGLEGLQVMRIVASKGLIALSPEESLIFFYLVYFFFPLLEMVM